MKWKWGIIVLLTLSVMVAGFWLTGGQRLVDLYRNYLSQDLPEKKYSWDDFSDRDGDNLNAGYYAGSVGNSILVWTLSGLKRYQHRDGLSVYRYVDTCQKIRELAAQLETSGEGGEIRETIEVRLVFTLTEWRYMVERGDYVSVRYIEEGGAKIIDKLHSSSNQHYPVEQLRIEQCQD